MVRENLTSEGIIQKITDIMVQCILTIHMSHEGTYCGRDGRNTSNFFKGKSNEEVMEWVRLQAKECGIPSQTVGSSHMSLYNKLFK